MADDVKDQSVLGHIRPRSGRKVLLRITSSSERVGAKSPAIGKETRTLDPPEFYLVMQGGISMSGMLS